jgi:hypothetical protein
MSYFTAYAGGFIRNFRRLWMIGYLNRCLSETDWRDWGHLLRQNEFVAKQRHMPSQGLLGGVEGQLRQVVRL